MGGNGIIARPRLKIIDLTRSCINESSGSFFFSFSLFLLLFIIPIYHPVKSRGRGDVKERCAILGFISYTVNKRPSFS